MIDYEMVECGASTVIDGRTLQCAVSWPAGLSHPGQHFDTEARIAWLDMPPWWPAERKVNVASRESSE